MATAFHDSGRAASATHLGRSCVERMGAHPVTTVRTQTPFAELLRRQRTAAGLTQEELAGRCGLGVRTLRELERGTVRRPHRETVALLAEGLGLAAEELAAFIAAAWSGDAPAQRPTAPPPRSSAGSTGCAGWSAACFS